MKPESEKYQKIISLLKESKPVLNLTEDIEREVIRKITRVNHPRLNLTEVFDFLFGWVYIGWVRRGLITASIALVLVFVFQQIIILKRIDMLSRQTVVIDKERISTPADEIEKFLIDYKNSERRLAPKTLTIPESQMRELLDSVNKLKTKYKDLENIIEGDPELKKLIEKKLIENNQNKINL
jgi:hypothetical protein